MHLRSNAGISVSKPVNLPDKAGRSLAIQMPGAAAGLREGVLFSCSLPAALYRRLQRSINPQGDRDLAQSHRVTET